MCVSWCWWATRLARERKGDTGVCLTRIHFLSTPPLSFYSYPLLISLKCTQFFALQRRIKEQGRDRRPNSNIFICVVLTRLDSPSERLMRRNGLVEEPSGCIHSCHHHLNPGLLNLQLWPPAWMGNDLSMFAWHPLLLRWNFSSCSHKNTHLNADLSTWVGKFFLMQSLACHALRLYLNFSSMPLVRDSSQLP